MSVVAILALGAVMFPSPAITTAASTCAPDVNEARTLVTRAPANAHAAMELLEHVR